MPSRTLKQLMQRLHTIEGSYFLMARPVFDSLPPVLKPLDNRITITRYLSAGDAASLIGGNVGIVNSIFNLVDSGFEECFTDTKNVVAHEPYRTIAVINHAFGEPITWKLENVALSRPQYVNPLGKQDRWGKRCVTAALQ